MKTVILLILTLNLTFCASQNISKNEEEKEFIIDKIVKRFEKKKTGYVMFESTCVDEILNPFDPKECESCYANKEIYVFWNEKNKSYIQKFDNCSEFNLIEIHNLNPSLFLKRNSKKMQTEKVRKYQIDENTINIVSHSCIKKYILNDGKSKYEKIFDYYDLTGKNENINYNKNKKLKLIILDTKLEKMIKDLDDKNSFERDKKTCYNNV
jgi:hypothetical protein